MISIACPQCSTPIPAAGRCGPCGLDASLLLQILGASARLARTSAQRAGDGAWQEAYNAAAESLRLSRRDNDLAAFVLLAATLAGARGPVEAVPRPRAEALPAVVAPWVDGLLAAATRLRGLAAGSPIAEIERALRELDERHPWLAGLGPKPPSEARKPEEAPPRTPLRRDGRVTPKPLWPALVAAAVITLAIGSLVVWWTVRALRAAPQAQIANLTLQLQRSQEELRRAPRPTAAKAPEDPLEQAVRQLEDPKLSGHSPKAAAALRDGIGRQAWRRGYEASARHRYDEARLLLEVAVQGSHQSDYWDDALYYLGKAYHRLGRGEEARATYRRLESEAPTSPFLPEAHRLLVRLDRHQGVGR